MTDLRAALAGYSDWLGYGHGERADAWLARLDVNRPELEAFRALPTPEAQPWIARPTAVHAADGRSKGVDAPLPADAQAALARARSRPDLNAFTWLPEKVAAAGAGFLSGVPIAVKDSAQSRVQAGYAVKLEPTR